MRKPEAIVMYAAFPRIGSASFTRAEFTMSRGRMFLPGLLSLITPALVVVGRDLILDEWDFG
jgi:hypothetical protein